MSNIYPKAQPPLTWPVLAMANARSNRWQARCLKARQERDDALAEVEALKKELKKATP